MSTISGRIEKKNVKSGQYGDLLIFKVGGESMSAFANDKKLSEECRGLLKELQQGDDVEFTISENTGKDGKTYKNVIGAVRVTQIQEQPEMEYPPKSNQSDDRAFPFSMKVSYCKDLMIAFPNEGEIDLLGRVEIVKKMARLMGE